MADKIFAKGLYAKEPRENAPSFVVGSISFKVDDFVAFLHTYVNEKGYVNIDLLKGKEGKFNAVLNEYGLKKKEEVKEEAPKDDSLPF